MKNVLLRAPLLTNSGYGVHSRQIFEWLESRKDINLHVDCLMWGATSWILDPKFENGLIGKIMSKSVGVSEKYDLTFQVQLPDEWDTSLGKVNVGITALVETDFCNPEWLDHINKMDRVVVPSNFTRQVIENTFKDRLNKTIDVVPEWYNQNINLHKSALSRSKDERFNFETSFNLLTVGTLTSGDVNCDRKNLVNTIAWALEEFKDDPEVGIVVKTSVGRGSTKDRLLTKTAVEQIVSEFRKGDFPKVHLIHGNMSSVDVAALFRSKQIHAYITATRGEGYGLPLVDAAASGMPVVATNWSGHLDFLGENFLKVDYDMKKILPERVDGRIFVENTSWAEPRKDSFKKQLRYLRENYKKSLDKAASLRKNVKGNFTKQKVCKKYEKIIRELC